MIMIMIMIMIIIIIIIIIIITTLLQLFSFHMRWWQSVFKDWLSSSIGNSSTRTDQGWLLSSMRYVRLAFHS